MDGKIKICYKCRNIQLKLNLYKNKTKKEGLKTQSINCAKLYHSHDKEKRNKRDRNRKQRGLYNIS